MLYQNSTPLKLAKAILEIQAHSPTTLPTIFISPIPQVNYEEDVPASPAQERLWFLQQLEQDSVAYNVNETVKITGNLNIQHLRESICLLVQRHPSLRTSFRVTPQQIRSTVLCQHIAPVDQVDMTKLFVIHCIAAEEDINSRIAGISSQPFDLVHGPLFRATLLQCSSVDYLLLDLHHIITDGWSNNILWKDLAFYYNSLCGTLPAATLPLPTTSYADFAIWQRELTSGTHLKLQLQYWKNALSSEDQLLQLPLDRTRPTIQRHKGAEIRCTINDHLNSTLKQVAQKQGTTLFTVLFSCFIALLQRYCNQTDIVVGTPIAGRNRQELEDIVGFFVNTLPIRVNCSKEITFAQLISCTHKATVDALAHQDVPFEMLVKELRPTRDTSYHPLFQTLFALQNLPESSITFSGLNTQSVEVAGTTSKFDLSLFAWESTNSPGITLLLNYDTDLFSSVTAKQMLAHYTDMINFMVLDIHQPISAVPMLPTDLNICPMCNHSNNLQFATIDKLFYQQVQKAPNSIALILGDLLLTYAELQEQVLKLAVSLRTKGKTNIE